jgi:predicted amidohydrolase YtcJ
VKASFAAALTALCIMLGSASASADVLVDNVNGVTVGKDGRVETFAAILIGNDGRITEVFQRKDKRPAKVAYRLDGKGRTMIPGLIDSHLRVMDLGFALLKAKAGFKGTPTGDPRPEDRDLAFLAAQEALLAAGITTAVDMGTTIEDWQTYRRAGDTGALRMRIVVYAGSARDMALIGGPRPTPWLYEDRLRMNGLALAIDGPLAAREAWLKAPYADAPGNSGTPRVSAIQLRNLMSRGAIDGFQVAVRAHGDAAVSGVLDAIEELAQTYNGDRRWRIEALDLIDPADLARLAQHGIVASLQPERLVGDPAMAVTRLGPTRAASLQPWRSIAQQRVTLAFGTGLDAQTPRPFAAMATAITRGGADVAATGELQSSESLSREQAFSALTTGAAHAIFAEGRLGRIAKGARADFLLVERDPMLASPDTLRATQPFETFVNGVKVHGGLAPARRVMDGPADSGSGTGKAAIDSYRDR